jgi:hypothetical protein
MTKTKLLEVVVMASEQGGIPALFYDACPMCRKKVKPPLARMGAVYIPPQAHCIIGHMACVRHGRRANGLNGRMEKALKAALKDGPVLLLAGEPCSCGCMPGLSRPN